MCQYFSCIITKDFKVHWIQQDPQDHEAIIEKLRLEDKKLEFRQLVRVEITPKDWKNVTRNPKDWQLDVDEQETLPEWYLEDEKKAQKLCWEAWEESVRINVVLGNERRTIQDMFVVAYGSSSVKAYGSSSVVAYGSSSVEAYGHGKLSIKSETATIIKDGKIHVLSLSNVVEMKEN